MPCFIVFHEVLLFSQGCCALYDALTQAWLECSNCVLLVCKPLFFAMQENQELWDLMQQDEVAELDTSAALESLDLTSSIPHTTHDMSPDTDQAYNSAGWANAGATNQPGVDCRCALLTAHFQQHYFMLSKL